ncbi:MAG: ACT domain-containing protein [Pseudomonadales bacterium]
MTLPDIIVRPESLGIYRLPADAALAEALHNAPMVFASRTDEELSIVCSESLAQSSGVAAVAPAEGISAPWSCLQVAGPIDFSVVGLMATISALLAAAEVSLFALSTFDTDYVLVRSSDLAEAKQALTAGGFHLRAL